MIKTKSVKVIDCFDWDELVQETYNKIYCFQQQNGCRDRGTYDLTIPCEWDDEDDMNDEIPEIINGDKMGVKFEVWLKRDCKESLNPTDKELKSCNYYWGKTDEDKEKWKNDTSHINLFWERNFYPDINTVANDLYRKGLIEAGEYVIDIDW